MVFSTPVFLFCYLTLVLAVYYLSPVRVRNLVLFIASLLFYFWGEQIYFLIMIWSTAIDFTHGLLVDRWKRAGKLRLAKGAVASSVIMNLALLFFFKYWDFIAASLQSIGITFMPVLGIHLPIGISFYTFQTMSYTIDVYRGDAKPQKSVLRFGTYVTLFPQLIAGPIIKYKEIADQLEERTHSFDRFASGVCIFMAGLSKKLLLANTLGRIWEIYKVMPEGMSVLGAWLGAIAFTFQIYFDFSGYSDMAIGLGRMLGFEFLKNFNYPYTAVSVTDFWRRWHISLSTWFRDYLYIPLGGNRVRPARWVLNLMIVWAVTGLWHGASWNFLFWGLYYGILLVLEKLVLGKYLEKLPSFLRHLLTMLIVVVGWVLFGLENGGMPAYLKVMFGGGPLTDPGALYLLGSYLPAFLAAAAGSTPLVSGLFAKIPEKGRGYLRIALVAGSLIVCTAYLVADTYNPFLYFRF
jgi:alginate O-acetyltransferase complex protein AlgI